MYCLINVLPCFLKDDTGSKTANDPEASNDSSENIFGGDGSETDDDAAAESSSKDIAASDDTAVVPVDAGSKADEGAPEYLIDRLQNLEEGEDEVASDEGTFDEEEGESRGIPGAAGIQMILSGSPRVVASSLGLVVACVVGSMCLLQRG